VAKEHTVEYAADEFGLRDVPALHLDGEVGPDAPAVGKVAVLPMPDGAFPDELGLTPADRMPRRAEATASRGSSPAPAESPSYPVVVTPQVEAFIERFTGSRRDIVSLWLSRSQQYLGMIREVFRKHGLPEDLAFVAMIESGFNPLAVSRAGAKGLWQFMAGTARRYGLRVDQWVDERYDAEKSTRAAAAYLKDLYQQFGSWALAKAAYNAGELRIVEAIRAVGSSDFWTLARSRFLQQETKEFVPAIHAATVIGRDPARYGFEPVEVKPPATETVAVPPSTSLKQIAAASGISLDTLRALNPALVRGITPPGGPYELKVPVGTRDEVVAALAPRRGPVQGKTGRAVAQGPARREIHVVRPHETVSSIAKRYGVPVADVLRWNRLDADDVIRPGDRLRIASTRLAAEREGSAGAR
jgi:membrane-bound lytic murein transglycosylase D